jgi:sec-independent protein translocase protein TatC
MSVFEHLEELRRTLFFVLIVAAVAGCGAWFVAEPALDVLVPPELGTVYYSSPAEGFMIRLKASAVIGLLVALPLVVARLWGFVAPGLFRHEKRAVVPVLVAGSLLFYGGLAFGYFAVVPRMVTFFLSFSGERLSPLLNVTQYFMFVAKFCLAFGIAFQMPLVIVLLAALGVVSPRRLWSQWRYGVIGIAVLAAWLTPPDAVSQIMMGAPLVALYFLSLLAAFLVARRRGRRGRS